MDASNILQVLALIVVFVIVLFATYYVTKWIAKSGAIQSHSRNIKVIETFKVAPNKYIQIIQLGSKYYSIGITKDNITFLTALEEEQLDFSQASAPQQIPFTDILNKFAKKNKK
jgi:flagellar protein FliO/FliZ